MGRKILIYGGTGGVGSATARILRARGDALHLVARDEERLATFAKELDAGCTAGDAAEAGVHERVATEAGDTLDGLVYAVGTITVRPLHRLTADDFLNDFRINAMGAALALQAALPALKKGSDPSVVLYSTVAVAQGFTFHASIGMAKGAVEGLMRSLATELAPGIRINCVAPSLTRTPLADRLLPNEQMASSIAGLHPLQRLGTPEDIAHATAFLLSPEAGWITGQVIGVDGGRSTLRTKG